MPAPDAREPEPPSSQGPRLGPGPARWQQQWYEVIFEHGTPAGRAFDIVLLVVIVASVVAVMLESVASVRHEWRQWLVALEWVITALFTVEFAARIACVNRPSKYIFSFFGLVDIISILPSYIGILLPDARTLAIVRTLRLLRVFRILKLARHVREGQGLLLALRRTWPKVTVFILVIVCAIVIIGTVMYLVEEDAGSGFDNIPVSIYWAIVTITTVGYGDIAPATALGKTLAALVMLLGYAVIIVPVGIFSAEVISQGSSGEQPIRCAACGHRTGDLGAKYCSRCGKQLATTETGQ